jgi:glycosyltransferase involved in cell wall biosynthesis
MADVLNACDIYAAPSRLEGYGMIQVEAMACGKPVVSINKMGPGETIIHNKTGLLAEPDPKFEVIKEEDVASEHHGYMHPKMIKFDKPKTFAYQAKIEDLRKHLIKLLTDDELRLKMGENGVKHVAANLEYKHIAKKMADITKDRLGL